MILIGFYFPLTVLGACFPTEKDLYTLLGMRDAGADHAVMFRQAVDYYESAIRFLYDSLLIKPNMINFGFKPTRYWFQCKILIKHLLTNQVNTISNLEILPIKMFIRFAQIVKKLDSAAMADVASTLQKIDTVNVVEEILSQKSFEIEQKICPEEVGFR